jgi:hypothetical protein
VEESVNGLIEDYPRIFWEELSKTSDRIAGVAAKIRTEPQPNTSLVRYLYITLFADTSFEFKINLFCY